MAPSPTHLPQLDSLPESPQDWTAIPLGAGQEPNAMGGPNSFQFTHEADVFTPSESVRRNPDETFHWISRVPERP